MGIFDIQIRYVEKLRKLTQPGSELHVKSISLYAYDEMSLPL